MSRNKHFDLRKIENSGKQDWKNLLLPDRARKKTSAQNQSQCARLIEKHLGTFIFLLLK